MKNFVESFSVLIAILICFSIIPNGAQAQIFDGDLVFLKEQILPIAQKNQHTLLSQFIQVVLPGLNKIFADNPYKLREGLNKISENKIRQKEMIMFAYNQARKKTHMPFGFSPKAIENNIFFEFELLCPIKEFLNLKPAKYESKMSEINIMLVDGYYSNTLKWLSLLPNFNLLKIIDIKNKKKFPEIEDLFIKPLLEFANKQKVRE